MSLRQNLKHILEIRICYSENLFRIYRNFIYIFFNIHIYAVYMITSFKLYLLGHFNVARHRVTKEFIHEKHPKR